MSHRMTTDAYAWLLTETWRDGSVHVAGIAVSAIAASRWVGADYEEGHSRSSARYKLIGIPDASSPETEKP